MAEQLGGILLSVSHGSRHQKHYQDVCFKSFHDDSSFCWVKKQGVILMAPCSNVQLFLMISTLQPLALLLSVLQPFSQQLSLALPSS